MRRSNRADRRADCEGLSQRHRRRGGDCRLRRRRQLEQCSPPRAVRVCNRHRHVGADAAWPRGRHVVRDADGRGRHREEWVYAASLRRKRDPARGRSGRVPRQRRAETDACWLASGAGDDGAGAAQTRSGCTRRQSRCSRRGRGAQAWKGPTAVDQLQRDVLLVNPSLCSAAGVPADDERTPCDRRRGPQLRTARSAGRRPAARTSGRPRSSRRDAAVPCQACSSP